MTSPEPQSQPAAPPRRPWTAPVVQSVETRPEISAYSGAGDPWNRPQR